MRHPVVGNSKTADLFNQSTVIYGQLQQSPNKINCGLILIYQLNILNNIKKSEQSLVTNKHNNE